jgi:hypothetical protein
MNPKTPKLNPKLLTEEQRQQLESYAMTQQQLQTLQDIADISQEMLTVLDSQTKEGGESQQNMGALLMDMRDSLNDLKAKEAPETPDFAKPVVEAVSKLEKTLTSSIKAIDVKPVIDAPQVNVSPPHVDLKGVEKAVKDIGEAFEVAVKQIDIPAPPETDFEPLLDAWDKISEQLESIDTATRMKPQFPNVLKVTNTDGSQIGSIASLTERYDYDDATIIYTATAPVGTGDSSTGWTITKYDLTDTNDASGKIATDVSWTNRATGSFN